MEKKIIDIANLFTATLRQLYVIETFCHWTTRGDPFYGDHLLFERLYKATAEDADSAAERFIGLFGLEAVDYNKQTELMNKVAKKFESLHDDPINLALTAEKAFIEFAKAAYDVFEDEGVLSLGLDDLIMSIASTHETAIYLLKQVLDKE
jgi:DNA-binding ferritin-like protein